MMRAILVALVTGCMGANALAEEFDYYRNLRYPSKLVPGVGLDKVEQEGGPDAVGYQRRAVQWWPRQGQDFVDVPEGAPLRTWTRNKGKENPEALAGVTRNWSASDPDTFKAHLIALRGFGTSSGDTPVIPSAVLRLEDGRQRAVVDYGPLSRDQTPIPKSRVPPTTGWVVLIVVEGIYNCRWTRDPWWKLGMIARMGTFLGQKRESASSFACRRFGRNLTPRNDGEPQRLGGGSFA